MTAFARTILIVDDDEAFRRALVLRLAASGFLCVTSGSGAQAFAEFVHGGIDAIVSDLNMPAGDGVAFAEAVRRTSQVPIIFVTGFKEDFKRRMRHISNVITLRKPISGAELAGLLQAILDQKDAGVVDERDYIKECAA